MNMRLFVDGVLVVLLIEMAVLWWTSRPRFIALLPNLAAGLCLIVAVEAALRDASVVLLSFLALAGLCHVVDLRTRLRG